MRVEPSDDLFQAEEYHVHPADATKAHHDAASALPLGEVSVNSYICRIGRGHPGGAYPMLAEGWAYVGGGNEIHRVEISEDEGEHWT